MRRAEVLNEDQSLVVAFALVAGMALTEQDLNAVDLQHVREAQIINEEQEVNEELEANEVQESIFNSCRTMIFSNIIRCTDYRPMRVNFRNFVVVPLLWKIYLGIIRDVFENDLMFISHLHIILINEFILKMSFMVGVLSKNSFLLDALWHGFEISLQIDYKEFLCIASLEAVKLLFPEYFIPTNNAYYISASFIAIYGAGLEFKFGQRSLVNIYFEGTQVSLAETQRFPLNPNDIIINAVEVEQEKRARIIAEIAAINSDDEDYTVENQTKKMKRI